MGQLELIWLIDSGGERVKKEQLLGIETDNAAVMTGINSGVHKLLKEYDLKDLLLIHCVCHSLQFAVSHDSNDTIHPLIMWSTWCRTPIISLLCLPSAGSPTRPYMRPPTEGKNPYKWPKCLPYVGCPLNQPFYSFRTIGRSLNYISNSPSSVNTATWLRFIPHLQWSSKLIISEFFEVSAGWGPVGHEDFWGRAGGSSETAWQLSFSEKVCE